MPCSRSDRRQTADELDGAKTAKGWTLKALLDRRGGRAYGCSLEGEELSQGEWLGNH